MTTTESLTEREQEALEHMRKAQELGTTLKEYASRFGLDVQKFYQLRKPLVRKGARGPDTDRAIADGPSEWLRISTAAKTDRELGSQVTAVLV